MIPIFSLKFFECLEEGGTYVLMMVSLGLELYFFSSNANSITPSKALIADTLSANRQLIGILGAFSPWNLILDAYSSKLLGRFGVMSGLDRIPFWKTF